MPAQENFRWGAVAASGAISQTRRRLQNWCRWLARYWRHGIAWEHTQRGGMQARFVYLSLFKFCRAVGHRRSSRSRRCSGVPLVALLFVSWHF
jgi:hypothetical protein